jgi:hypothetical protein
MAEVKIGVKIISELKNFVTQVIHQEDVLDLFRKSGKDFTRNRKLPFDRLVLLIAKLCKKTLSIELEGFFQELGEDQSCSVSAFTQQRIKLKASFFYWWNQVLWKSYYHYSGENSHRWNGLRIIAADGSNISLLNTPALSRHFGGQSNSHGSFTQAKTFYYYDVLNELVLFPRIEPYRYGEVQMAYEGIHQLSPDMLVIYDRYFCSYKMFALHLWAEQQIPFVIRGNENQNMVKKFIASGKRSDIVQLTPSAAAIAGLKESGYMITRETTVAVRLIRVELEKTIEVLVTNLSESDGYSDDQFKALYFLRWGVETNISIQKNIMQLESFSGLTVESVEQDFYATVFMTNLHSVLIKDAQSTVNQISQNKKYPMKVNRNKSFGKLKSSLIALFIQHDPQHILLILHGHFIRDTLPVRKNRSFPRITKNKPGRSKHRTFSNFKLAC